MIRTLLRLILLAVLVIGIAAFFFGYRFGSDPSGEPAVERPAATTGGREPIDTSRAREAGAEVGEAVATGANEAQRAVENAAITGKVKAKMALDDRVKALDIDVDTKGSVVTLSGIVRSEEERKRALDLARDTDGVTSVIDNLTLSR